MEQVKAISQNVMHSTTAITDEFYSRMNYTGMNEIITGMGKPADNPQPTPRTDTTGQDIMSILSIEEKKHLLKILLGI